MILQQFYLNCLAHASYLIGDASSGVGVIVDPQRDVAGYLSAAETHGLRIQHVFLTHFHADFLAGHLELRDRTGATIHLGAKAAAEYAFHPMADGDVLDLGRVRLHVLETPGHTVESISILAFDLAKDASRPHAVLTGDTLFIGDVGRPDLRASLGWSADALGRMLYHSLRTKLLPLPDETLIYPAHGAGSLCGKAISQETVSSLGDQRRLNYALQPMTEDSFLRIVTADQPDAPAYFTYDAVLNTKERPTLERTLTRGLVPLTVDVVLGKIKDGAQLLDVRDAVEFGQAHMSGSVNVGLGGQYASWAGTVIDHDRPIVLIAEPGREEEAAMRLGRIGFDLVDGYLQDGMRALASRPELVSIVERLVPAVVAEALKSTTPPLVVDVRSPHEWSALRIDAQGGINIPLSRLREQMHGLPKDRWLLVHCAGGYRSSIAASLLQRHGFTSVTELAGGLSAWQAAGLPTAN